MPSRLSVLSIFALALTACAGTKEEAPPQPKQPIFRYVAFTRDTVWLGKPLGTLSRFATSATDTTPTIPASEFAGADIIRIFRTASDTVYQVNFGYGERHNVEQLKDGYLADLGAPAVEGQDSIFRVARRYYTWRDADTEFTLAIFSAPVSGSTGVARLTDLRRGRGASR